MEYQAGQPTGLGKLVLARCSAYLSYCQNVLGELEAQCQWLPDLLNSKLILQGLKFRNLSGTSFVHHTPLSNLG